MSEVGRAEELSQAQSFPQPFPVEVQVTQLSGEHLSLLVSSSTCASELKESISAAWEVPPEFQVLLCGDDILRDADTLCGFLCRVHPVVAERGLGWQRPALLITLLATLPQHWDTEQWPAMEPGRKVRALLHLEAVAQRDGDVSGYWPLLYALGSSVLDASPEVRRKGMEMLALHATSFEERALEMAAAMLEHDFDSGVREDSADMFRMLSIAGVAAVPEQAAHRLRHQRWYVRLASVRALIAVSQVDGHQQPWVCHMLRALLDEEMHDEVQQAAMDALSQAADRNQTILVKSIFAHSSCPQACQTMGAVVERGTVNSVSLAGVAC